MGNKVAVAFALKFHADGTSDTLSCPLLTSQWFTAPPVSGSTPLLTGIGSPTSAHGLSAGSLTIAGSSIILGTLVVTFDSTVPEGDYVLQGTFWY